MDPGRIDGLREVRVARVEDDRLATRERVIENARQTVVPPLRHPRRNLGGAAFLGVVVHVEVRRLQNRELETVVLHFVPTEILRVGCDRRQQQCDRCCDGPLQQRQLLCWPVLSRSGLAESH
jgi:hypothetical protein